jgi:hypothetical protein
MSKIAIQEQLNGIGKDEMGPYMGLTGQDLFKKSYLKTIHEQQLRTNDVCH